MAQITLLVVIMKDQMTLNAVAQRVLALRRIPSFSGLLITTALLDILTATLIRTDHISIQQLCMGGILGLRTHGEYFNELD